MWNPFKRSPAKPAVTYVHGPMFSARHASAVRDHNKRIQKQMNRTWKAAETNRLASNWGSHTTPIDSKIRQGLTALRARSREQALQNDYVRHFIRTVQNNVIGAEGFTIQPKVAMMTRNEMDQPANKALELAYIDAGRRGNYDTTGTLSRHDIWRLMIPSLIVDGEFIAIEHQGKGYGKYSRQIEVVDPELLDVNKNEKRKNGNWVRMGIEYNPQNQPVRFYFRVFKPELDTYSSHEHRVVPASRVHHVFYPEFVGQSRGIPWLATTLFSLKQLDAYDEAAIVAARIGASSMGFFHSEGGDQYRGNEESDDGAQVTDIEPGTFEDIGNKKFTTFDPKYPHEQYPEFKKAQLRRVSSGFGAQYETIANDREGVNYTSIRHGTLEDRENWKTIQGFLIDVFVRPDREAWLETALLTNSIKIGRNPLNRTSEDYYPAKYQGRRWDWVDPAKDMQAYETEKGMRAISVSEIIRRRGRDPDEVFLEIAEENEKFEKLGIKPEPPTPTAPASNGDNQDDDED